MRETINHESTTTEPPPLNGQPPTPLGGLNAFYWYQIFALNSAVVEAQKKSGFRIFYANQRVNVPHLKLYLAPPHTHTHTHTHAMSHFVWSIGLML